MMARDLYINFVLHAIYGKLREADAIMRVAGDHVRGYAAELRERHAYPDAPIYRGLLLDPAKPYRSGPSRWHTFSSWSEDRDVACWFASTKTVISEPLVESNPALRGHVITLPTIPSERVLFHYSWRGVFGVPIERFALLHPEMGHDGFKQIGWSLRTQRELLIDPIDGLSAEPIDEPSPLMLHTLEQKCCPPWVAFLAAPEHPQGEA